MRVLEIGIICRPSTTLLYLMIIAQKRTISDHDGVLHLSRCRFSAAFVTAPRPHHLQKGIDEVIRVRESSTELGHDLKNLESGVCIETIPLGTTTVGAC
jgi:hypothetical protein